MSVTPPDVVLVGFRGAGKSTLGERLAARLARPFVDTDALIEAHTNSSLGEYLMRVGERSFRITEAAVVAGLGSCGGRVIATGGGVPLDPANRDTLKRHGFVVFLDVDPEVALTRIARDGRGRPPLTRMDLESEARELIARRRPVYAAFADLRVDANGELRAIEDVIAFELKERGWAGRPS
jgi:shikimate kinase